MAIDTYFQAIANAIRAKTGESTTITPSNMPAAIHSIETGSSIIKGTTLPTNNEGSDGDFYFYGRNVGNFDTGLGWSANSDYLVNDANQLLATISGRSFYKTNSGYAFGANGVNTNYSGPYLISSESNNAMFSYNTQIRYSTTISNIPFYLYGSEYFMGGQVYNTNGALPDIVTNTSNTDFSNIFEQIFTSAQVTIPAISGTHFIVSDIYYKIGGIWRNADYVFDD